MGCGGAESEGEAACFLTLPLLPTVWAAVTLLWPRPPDAARPSRATVQAEIDRLKVCGLGRDDTETMAGRAFFSSHLPPPHTQRLARPPRSARPD